MSYSNRRLIRKPFSLLRASEEEREKLLRFAERVSNGAAVAPTLLDVLLKAAEEQALADERMHAANASQRARVDSGPFAVLMRA